MSAPRVKGRLTDDEVADVRALGSVGTTRRLVERVEEILEAHVAPLEEQVRNIEESAYDDRKDDR